MVTIISILFILGYILIALEHAVGVNKAATALVTGIICWSVFSLSSGNALINDQLAHHLGDIASILFFLLGAMVIVELIDANDGFNFIISRITTKSRRKLVWVLGLLAFFLSAVLDNLTTTIVMVSLVRKLITSKEDRIYFVGLIVIAANAGGAWSPIGDVTTTMLWMGGQVTTMNIILETFLPSLICFLVPAFIIAARMKGNVEPIPEKEEDLAPPRERKIFFLVGVMCLLAVPVFKIVTGLPPYMGILLGLGVMWIVSESVHSDKNEREKDEVSVNHALKVIDTPSILFFLGILLSVAALQSTGILANVARGLDRSIGDINIISILTGFLSAVVDNVPLVAAAQGMYGLEQYPTDHHFWEFLAYCAGTGGSMLIIGSAAGVAAMGMEKIRFFDYLKKIGWLALLGYLAGAGVFIVYGL
jgi:Na+/H+ antiporter NhaD/arsenite permease-like protein